MYKCSVVCFTGIGISRLLGSIIEHTLLPTRLLIPMHVKHTTPYNFLPEDEPSGSKFVDDTKKLKIKILF